MKKVFKLKESELIKIIEKVVKEQTDERYMFFSNLEQIQRQMGLFRSHKSNPVVHS